jgi:predicted nucleic acid-binding protein
MAEEEVVYLDAGPIVAMLWAKDKFYDATKNVLSTLPSKKVTSFLGCLEALVVLRRVSSIEQDAPLDQRTTYRLWGAIVREMENAGVEVKPVHILELFDNEKAMEMLGLLAGSPTRPLPPSKKGKVWIRSVGVMDCLHLKAAESLGATHFLTTDRCFSNVETDLVMILTGDYGGASDVIWPALMERRSSLRSGETRTRNEEALTC